MNLTELRELEWIMYEIHAGSELYNTNTADSDADIRGIYNIPLYKYLCNRYPTKIVANNEKEDIVFMEIVTYLNLACKGNPNVVDWLFFKQAETACKSLEMCELIDIKEKFITKEFLLRSISMGISMREGSMKDYLKNDTKAAFKKLSHARRIVITIGNYLNTGIYTPSLEGDDADEVRTIKTTGKDFYEVHTRVELGFKSLENTILHRLDIPEKFDDNLKDELILNFKTKYHGIETPE